MSLELDYTVQGRGGLVSLSPGSKPVWWADTTNWLPWANLDTFGFTLFPNAQSDWPSATYGSILLSMPFKVNRSQGLNVKARVISTESLPWYNVGFALLLMNSQVAEILFAFRSDGIGHRDDFGPIAQISYATPSSGVIATPTKETPSPTTLGGVTYGQPIGISPGGTFTAVSASCAPAGGEYRLLFGICNVNGLPSAGQASGKSALIVDDVDL